MNNKKIVTLTCLIIGFVICACLFFTLGKMDMLKETESFYLTNTFNQEANNKRTIYVEDLGDSVNIVTTKADGQVVDKHVYNFKEENKSYLEVPAVNTIRAKEFIKNNKEFKIVSKAKGYITLRKDIQNTASKEEMIANYKKLKEENKDSNITYELINIK